MNTTKRKFNALVQGIGGHRSPTPAKSNPPQDEPKTTKQAPPKTSTTGTMAVDAEILAKRRRLGLPDSSSPSTSPTTTISNVVLRKWSGQAKDGTQAAAKYCPSDRTELVKRLATFQELTEWTPKPDRVNEVEWAKRGWICQGKERVRCTLCNKEVVVKLKKEVGGREVPIMIPSEIDDALVNKYVVLMVDSHHEDCLWRKRGCDDSLLRLSFANANASFEQLRQRYDELCARQSFLPYEFNLRLPVELDIGVVLTQLPKDFFTSPAPPKQASDPKNPNRVALALALMGWQGLSNPRIGAVPNSASCHTCLRRLGLWMFKSKEVSPDGEIITPAPMDHLDPVKEHRFFCPWKNPQAQRLGSAKPNPETDLPAWKMLAQSLKNEAYLRGALEDPPRTQSKPHEPTPLSSPLSRRGVASPRTPGAETTDLETTATPLTVLGPTEDDDEAARDAKDKERWARLRKVKSLFDTKSARRLKRATSRPGTATSTKSGVGD